MKLSVLFSRLAVGLTCLSAAFTCLAFACNATPPTPAHKSEALVAPSPPPLKAKLGNSIVADDPSLPDGICPECRRQGRVSTVSLGETTNQLVTVAPWYDERGGLHSGDNPSTTTTTFSCSNGHTWARTRRLSTGTIVLP